MKNKYNIYLLALMLVISFVLVNSTLASGTSSQITVAGTIRNTGKGWHVISDSVHVPLNITKVETDKEKIILWHNVGAKKIHTFSVTADETMAKEGYTVGVSGGTYYSHIYIYDKNQNLVEPDKYISWGGNIWIYGLLSQ